MCATMQKVRMWLRCNGAVLLSTDTGITSEHSRAVGGAQAGRGSRVGVVVAVLPPRSGYGHDGLGTATTVGVFLQSESLRGLARRFAGASGSESVRQRVTARERTGSRLPFRTADARVGSPGDNT
jgi:hypothetical protein